MTDFVLWTRSLRGNSISLQHGHKNLNEYERGAKLCDPIPIKPEHALLPLSELAKLYPAPVSPDEPPPSAPTAQALSAA